MKRRKFLLLASGAAAAAVLPMKAEKYSPFPEDSSVVIVGELRSGEHVAYSIEGAYGIPSDRVFEVRRLNGAVRLGGQLIKIIFPAGASDLLLRDGHLPLSSCEFYRIEDTLYRPEILESV
jgi:hypothetical protein